MSLSSRAKKIKAKGAFQELKLVQTVSRKGLDTIRTEEVKTPRRGAKNGLSTSHLNETLSSPIKRQKLEPFDDGPILWDIEGPNDIESVKRHTGSFLCSVIGIFSYNMFKEPKRLFESVLKSRKDIFGPPPRPRNAANRPLLQCLWHLRSPV
jgi:hypothetical protein